MNEQTPEQWAAVQMQAAVDSLPKCGHVECMNEAVVMLSKAMLARVGTEVPIPTMSNDLILLMTALGAAHQQLGQMRLLASAEKGTLQ